ncbi:MAG: HlyD family secretion protein [Nitrospiria bacterium]
MKSRLFVVFIIFAALIFTFAGAPFYKKPQELNYLERVGLIEATEVHLSAKISERIIALPVDEGDHVKADALVVRLDDEQMKAEESQAEANVRRGEAELLNGKAKIVKAKVKFREAERNLERLSQLRKEELVSISDLDRVQTLLDLARAELDAEKASLHSAKADLMEREAHLRLVRVRLKEGMITTPVSGIVTLKAFEVGEMVSPGVTILAIIDPESIWARVDLDEGEIGRIRLGNRAEVVIASMQGRVFKGSVAEIGEAGGFATQRDTTRGKQDIKTFRIKVRISSPSGFLKAGMTAKVRIFFGTGEGLKDSR